MKLSDNFRELDNIKKKAVEKQIVYKKIIEIIDEKTLKFNDVSSISDKDKEEIIELMLWSFRQNKDLIENIIIITNKYIDIVETLKDVSEKQRMY